MGLSDTLPLHSSTVLGAHPFSGLYPIVHLGQGLRTGSSFPGGEGGSRAGSHSFSRVLQLLICGDESLGVVETRDQPSHSEPSCPQVSIQDEDSPVCSPLSEGWGLDGVLGSQGCILAGSSSSRQPQVPEVHGLREGFPIQGPLFQSLHCSASFHTGHGSGISFFSIAPESVFVDISTTGLSKLPLGPSSSRLWTPSSSCVTHWGSLSTRACPTWFRPSTLYIWA